MLILCLVSICWILTIQVVQFDNDYIVSNEKGCTYPCMEPIKIYSWLMYLNKEEYCSDRRHRDHGQKSLLPHFGSSDCGVISRTSPSTCGGGVPC